MQIVQYGNMAINAKRVDRFEVRYRELRLVRSAVGEDDDGRMMTIPIKPNTDVDAFFNDFCAALDSGMSVNIYEGEDDTSHVETWGDVPGEVQGDVQGDD